MEQLLEQKIKTDAPKLVTTADAVETRIGTLTFERGYPTEETKRKVFDEIDYQRAVQCYLWAYPVVSFQSILMETKRGLGVERNVMGIADNFVDPKSLWLTANDITIYALANLDLGKDGPMVIEIAPGAIVGLIDDFWQRSVTDVGLPGPYGDKGGKFLLLPPGYSGEVPQSGYVVLNGTMNNYNVMVRGILVNNDKDAAVKNVKATKIYPLTEAGNPKPTKFISMSGAIINTLPPTGIQFWEYLSMFINNNPVDERDRFFMAMLKHLGIEKGKSFKPDARQKGFLEEATHIGDAMGRVMLFEGHERIENANVFAGTYWNWVTLVNPKQETEYYSQLDERLHYTYGAIYTTPGIGIKHAGPGSTYVQAFKDKDGNRFDGSKSYRMKLLPNIPAAAFWSLTLYDTATRSMLQNPTNDGARSSYDKLNIIPDGSLDLYFSPKAPAGNESNWIETVPGKGFYPMFRFYTPKVGLFDGSWKMSDIEVAK
ncbi:DUF1254 domain-containing protein [Flavitalea sp.]|nr:DUF1254 domain-containing protein [Flavitalea sp.]